MFNKKAVFGFLGLTFGLTITLTLAARMLGFTLYDAPSLLSQAVVLMAMFVPALSALITQKFIVRRPIKELGLTFGPWSMYAKTYAVLVAMFVLEYAVIWQFFLRPDFTLTSFLNQFNISAALPLPAWQMIAIFAALTLFVAPLANILPSLGEELGWRGFLLPSLEPLGKPQAALLSGLIWGLWHTPMILLLGFFYGRQFLLGGLLHLLMVTGLGVWFAYVWFETRSTVQAAFMHAVFNAHAYGVWVIIFVSDDKLLVGAGGIVNVIACLLLGAWSLRRMQLAK